MNYQDIIDKDQMWYILGLRLCKLRKYCHTIYFDILNRQFGKSHKLVKKFYILDSKFGLLTATLDNIIQADYHISINILESLETQPSITDIFYNLYSYDNNEIISYNEKIDDIGNKILNLRPYPNLGERYNKKITYDDKEFIDKFIHNLNEYLVKIQFLINYNLNYKNKLKKKILQLSNYLFKLIPEISEVQILN